MKLRIVQINCLDLFIFLDQKLEKSIKHYQEDEWQKLTYSQKGNKPLEKTKKLAETLLKTKADIICLNEVGGIESLTNFNKYFLKNRYVVAMADGSSDRGIDTGFLVKKKIDFKISGFKSHKSKKEDKDFKFSRTVNHLEIKKRDKTVLNLFGVHLRSKRNGANDAKSIEVRFNEVKHLTHIMKNIRNENKAPYILLGDLNGSASLKDRDFEFDVLYQKTSLRDIHDIKKSSNQDKYSYVRFEGKNINYSQLDYIFLSKDLHKKIKRIKRWLYRNGKEDIHVTTLTEKFDQPSDHYPQMVDIKL